jgi:adenylate cyclase
MPNEQKVTRKLRAILCADVKGYSLLMADDEFHTIQTLKAYRQIMSDLIKRYSGRVVDNPGDNLLAEFSSAVDAVECSVQIQNKLKKENAKYVDDKRLQFRIGINIGDIVHDGDRIYGSGVNIAARIEGFASHGGICISRNTYDHVKDKLELSFEYLGEHEAKNIKEPVRVYKVLVDLESPKPEVEEQLELPDKPSIAVLPFTNMSSDSEQEYFSDGITEDIIAALSRSPWLFVISRNSSFLYRGAAVNVRKVSRELGVRYILEGSVRKAEDRIRVTAQLIDGTVGSHIWAEKYDAELQDIFDLQDQITQQVVSATLTKIQTYVSETSKRLEHPDVVTWDLLARGWKLYYELTKGSLAAAEKILRRAVASAPTSCDANYLLAGVLIHQVSMGYAAEKTAKFSEALKLVKKAISIDDNNEYAHWTLGLIHRSRGRLELAIAEYKRAIELNPNCSLAYGSLGSALCFSGDPDEAIKNSEIAIRTNPTDPSIFFRYASIAMAHFVTGRYQEAIQWARKSIHRKPIYRLANAILTSSLAQLKLFEEAKESLDNYLERFPNETISELRNDYLFANSNDAYRFEEGLRKAGLRG